MSNRYFPLTARWPWGAAALLGLLLLLGRASHAQITNLAGTIFSNTGILATTGTVQNAGTFVPTSGTLTINSGDFLNTGTITSTGTGTVALVDASAARNVALGNQSLPSLSLNVPTGTTLTNSGGITTTLTLTAGLLSTGNANTLTLAPTASVSGESNTAYVVGHLNQAQTLSGSSAVNFGGMGFTANPAGASYTLTVDRRAGLGLSNVSFGQNPNNANKGIDRIWAVTGSGSATPATIVLSWLSANDNGLSFSGTNAQVYRSDNGGTSWVKQNAVADGSGHAMTITTNSLTSSLYTVTTTAAPLPVELLTFQATKVATDGQLRWQTASEKNAAFMEVQASGDGTRWTVLGQMPAAGTSTSPRAYSFLDRNLSRYQMPRVYYRLRLVDQDGTAAYSALVSLVPDAAALAFGLSASPNPLTGPLTVQVRTPQAGEITLLVLDAVGRTVRQRTLSAPGAGLQALTLPDLGSLPTGSYLLLARQGTRHASLHLVHP